MACYSGVTVGSSWFYTDCYGVYQSGSGPGFQICYDSEAPTEGIATSSDICIPPSPTPTPTVTPTPPLSYNYYDADPCCPPGPSIVVRIPSSIPVAVGTSGFDFSGKCYFITGPSGSPTYDFATSTVFDDYCSQDPCTCPTPTPTVTPTVTPTPSVTPTVTPTPSVTPSNTPTSTVTPTPSVTPSNTPTSTVTPTPSVTTTPSNTPTSSVTPTPSITPTTSNTPTPSLSPGASPTPSPTNTPTSSVTPTPSVTTTPSNTPTSSVTPTPSITPTTSNTPTPSLSPGASPTPSPTNTPTSSVTPTPSLTPGCGCTQIDTDLPFYATGNTLSNSVYNNIILITYDECGGSQTVFTATTATASNIFYLCAQNGKIDLVEFYQNNSYYSSSTFPWQPTIITPDPAQGNFGYNIYGTCAGNPCGPLPTPTPTPTVTTTPTPTVTTTPTPTSTPLTCPSNFCVDINIDTYSGYNGTYSFYTTYNEKNSWTGGTLPGYIYYKTGDTSSWCLSDSLGGDCISTGPVSPFCDGECPDFDPTIVYSGACTPTPVDPCSGISFSADFYCNVVTVVTPTPTPTNAVTPTPTPTPTDTTCSSFGAVVSVTDTTPTPTPSSTPTPTPTFARSLNTGGTVNFVIDSGDFVCYDVKELSDCDTGILYYVAGNLQFTGTTIDVGTTFKAYLNNDLKCLTYQRDVNGSATAYIGNIQSTGTTCASCGITPTPTPTSSPTPTPTMTPTPTPVPTVAPTTSFVFQSCIQNKLVIQTAQPGTLVSGRIVKINNECFTYLGSYTNYIPPVGYQTVYNNFITSTPTTVYDSCLSCVTPPTYVYQVIKQTVNCQNTGSAIYVSKPSNVSTPTVGQYVRLSGSGYVGCWKVINIVTQQPTSTSIIGVFNQCDCDI